MSLAAVPASDLENLLQLFNVFTGREVRLRLDLLPEDAKRALASVLVKFFRIYPTVQQHGLRDVSLLFAGWPDMFNISLSLSEPPITVTLLPVDTIIEIPMAYVVDRLGPHVVEEINSAIEKFTRLLPHRHRHRSSVKKAFKHIVATGDYVLPLKVVPKLVSTDEEEATKLLLRYRPRYGDYMLNIVPPIAVTPMPSARGLIPTIQALRERIQVGDMCNLLEEVYMKTFLKLLVRALKNIPELGSLLEKLYSVELGNLS